MPSKLPRESVDFPQMRRVGSMLEAVGGPFPNPPPAPEVTHWAQPEPERSDVLSEVSQAIDEVEAAEAKLERAAEGLSGELWAGSSLNPPLTQEDLERHFPSGVGLPYVLPSPKEKSPDIPPGRRILGSLEPVDGGKKNPGDYVSTPVDGRPCGRHSFQKATCQFKPSEGPLEKPVEVAQTSPSPGKEARPQGPTEAPESPQKIAQVEHVLKPEAKEVPEESESQ